MSLNLSRNKAVFWFGGLYTHPTKMFFPWGTVISTNKDSISSGSDNLHSLRSLYWKSFCKQMSTPPPVLDLRWFETKLCPVILTSSAVQSVSHVSEIPILRLPSTKFNWSRFFSKLRAFRCIMEKFILSLREATRLFISSSSKWLLEGRPAIRIKYVRLF